MAVTSLVLTDVDAGLHREQGELRPTAELSLAGSRDWSIRWRTLRGGVSDGVSVVELNSGGLSLSVGSAACSG